MSHSPNPPPDPNRPPFPQGAPPPEDNFSELPPPNERQQLAREAARHSQARQATLLTKVARLVMYLVAALEGLLGLRLTAANPDNLFAAVIYRISRPFVRPFSTLFISPTFDGSRHIFDVNVLVAMATYLVLLLLFLGLLRVLFEE